MEDREKTGEQTLQELRELRQQCQEVTAQENLAEEAASGGGTAWERTFDALPDPICIVDCQHRIVRANRAMAGRLGILRTKLVGRSCYEVIHDAERPPDFCPHTRLLADGQEHTVEVTEPCLRGDFLVTTSPLHDINGKLLGSVHVARDITDRKRAEATMRQSQYQLTRLADNLPHSVVYQATHDVSGHRRFLYLSAGAERILGITPEEVKADASLLYLQILEPFRKAVEQAEIASAMNQSLFEVEVPIRVTDGSVKWLHICSMPSREGDGPMVWNGVATDVTDRKQAEEALRASEERYRTLFRTMTEGFALHEIVTDENGQPCDYRYLDVNPAFERLTGKSRSEVVGQLKRHVTPGEDEFWIGTYGEVALGGPAVGFEHAAPGSKRHWQVYAYSPAPRQFAVLFSDISERKLAEQALRESEERCRLLIETIPQLAWRSSPDGLDLDCNRRWYEYTGQTPAQVRGHGWLAAVHPEDLFRVTEKALHAANTRSPYEVEYRLRRASDGSYRWHLARAIPAFGEDGQVLCWFGSATDVEELKQAQEILKAAHDEQLQRHRAELAHVARLSMLGEMAAGLAHELNQPLHAVKNYAGGGVRRLLKTPQRDEELVVALEQISAEANRAAEIVRRVRRFVQKREPSLSEVAVNSLVEEVALLCKTEIEQHRAKVVLESSPGLPPIVGDAIQIEQVLVNLLRNGLEAMDDTPEDERLLGIRSMLHGNDTVQVDVCDRGKGIGAEDLERVFDPFFTTKPEGMGMGLAISRSIVQALGGRLWVTTGQDRGCTFHFTLPVGKRS